MTPRLIAIVAMAGNRVIGRDGTLPWHFPEDLKFFKRTTLGHPILMGRTTFESIGKPLPGRQNIVLSRTLEPREGLTVIRHVSELASVTAGAETVFVIGGAQVYAELLPQCDALYLTLVKGDYEGDTHLPAFEHQFELKQVLEETEALEFRYYERRSSDQPTVEKV
ncbi:dihydrofolate reductase [Prosthecobacter debontii]|uniref:Dihydrofolate reductase n=1 Tax=Prosthecobacter debontii TaxID=48467 RepID=A0A1T4XCG3_9BACT|nr:dihydrofolate reductase [Prosthecobacter debontii]SKA86855.1 dihydrofolate reductase [Prosthecobacter debontii]